MQQKEDSFISYRRHNQRKRADWTGDSCGYKLVSGPQSSPYYNAPTLDTKNLSEHVIYLFVHYFTREKISTKIDIPMIEREQQAKICYRRVEGKRGGDR